MDEGDASCDGRDESNLKGTNSNSNSDLGYPELGSSNEVIGAD